MKIMTERRKKEILKLIDNLYFEFGTKNPISICKGLGIEIVSANIEMKGLYTVVLNSKLIVVQALLGKDGGKLKGQCDYEFIVPGKTSDRVQEIHMMILHIIIEGVERIMFPENYVGE